MKAKLLVLLLTTVGTLAWPWGQMESAPSPQAVVVDSLGRTINLTAAPHRIVVAGRAVAMVLDTLYMFGGVGDRIVGVGATDQGLGDFYPIIDPGVAGKARFANSVGAEQVLAIHPDLVVLKTYMRSTLGEPMERVGTNVMYVDLESPDRFASDLQAIGMMLGQSDRAQSIVSYYSGLVKEVQDKVAGADRPSVLLLQYSQASGFSIPPATWIQTRVVETAGGAPVWKDANPGAGWAKVEL